MNEIQFKMWAIEALAMASHPEPMFPPSPYYRFLRVIARNLQPKLAVELGVCGGGGSLHIALGNPRGQVVGIDVVDDHQDNIAYIKEHCPNFKFVVGDSVEMAGAIWQEFGRVGLLFVDTTHTRQQTEAELKAWEPYLSGNAVVCFDDLFRDGMGGFWDGLKGNKVRLDILHQGGSKTDGGFGVWWK